MMNDELKGSCSFQLIIHHSAFIIKNARPGGSAATGALLAPDTQCADCTPGGDSRVFEKDAPKET